MRNLLVILSLLGLLSCSKQRRASEPFPRLLTSDVEWITYEGILPTENGHEVLVELKLVPGTPGMDSHFQINEKLLDPEKKNSFSMSTSSRGTYSVLFGPPGHNIIKINNLKLVGSLMKGKVFRQDDRVTQDLFLKSKGDHELVLIDGDFVEVDSRYTLIRRSDLLTVEGYFTVYDDTTEYYERNTRKKWSVAQFGLYDQAVKNYNSLAREKHEGIYLKALSYSIRQIDRNGNEIDALVFKDILRMDSARIIQ